MRLLRAYGWETRKLARQKRTWAGLAAAMLYALAFVIALSLKKHAGLPPDVPLAHDVTKTGVVLPLALLTFATFFGAAAGLGLALGLGVDAGAFSAAAGAAGGFSIISVSSTL